jgi:hypothetical protein
METVVIKYCEGIHMSIKEEGCLQDYIAAGLIGFAVGMAVSAVLILFGTLYSFVAGLNWGRVIALGAVAGIFGFFPGGFVAGYLNFRIHKTDGSPMEGLAAGIMASLANLFITLFVFVAMAVSASEIAGQIMGAWGLTFVLWGFIFYPLGGYVSGMSESKPIPMPPILKFQMGAGAAPPPPPPPGAATCPICGGQLTFIEQYQRWYCYKCKKYT